MCKSQEEGGARCAAHYRVAATHILERLEAVTSSKDRQAIVSAARYPSPFEHAERGEEENTFTLLKHYAATPQGRRDIELVRDRVGEAARTGDFGSRKEKEGVAAYLTNVLKRGGEQREADKEVRKVIAKQKSRQRDADRNDAVITRERAAKYRAREYERTLGSEYPYLKEMWNPELNGGAELHELPAGSSRLRITLQCPDFPDTHPTWTERGDQAATAARAGRHIRCAVCVRMGFDGLQENLASLRNAIGGDLDALDSLSPTMRMLILEQTGTLKKTGISDSLLMSSIRGELSISDIVEANSLADLEGRFSDVLSDVDVEIANSEEVSLDDLVEEDYDRDTMKQVDSILASSGAIALMSDNAVMADRVVTDRVEAMWNEVLGDPNRLDEIVSRLQPGTLANEWEERVAAQFLTELDEARNTPLPEGYKGDLDPMLSQRRFMVLAGERRRIANWSGTGAGKTLSAALSLEHLDAKESLVVAPSDVLPRWQEEFKAGFPDTEVVLVREDAAVDRDIAPVPDGKRRVWLVNYEQFSGENGVARIDRLTDRVDAVVMDEIHKLKSQSEETASRRHRAAQEFLDNASQSAVSRDRELAVIGMSATPVVNDLDEAKSVFRLISGAAPGVGTEQTVSNVTKFHHRMRTLGVRQLPQLSHSIRRNTVAVDITGDSATIVEELAGRRNSAPGGRLHGLQVEQALLPYKMPAIRTSVASSVGEGKPVIVYSKFTTGMVDPIVEGVSDMKRPDGSAVRAVRYTGDETPEERKDIVQRFRRGEIDVLVASSPITTGVDGLQDVCSHLVVACPPYTSAELEQLEGRVYRTGLNSDVRIDYIVTSARRTPEVSAWSWCASRLKAIRSKRTLADAVMDGNVPDALVSKTKGMRGRALAGIQSLAETVDLS